MINEDEEYVTMIRIRIRIGIFATDRERRCLHENFKFNEAMVDYYRLPISAKSFSVSRITAYRLRISPSLLSEMIRKYIA